MAALGQIWLGVDVAMITSLVLVYMFLTCKQYPNNYVVMYILAVRNAEH